MDSRLGLFKDLRTMKLSEMLEEIKDTHCKLVIGSDTDEESRG